MVLFNAETLTFKVHYEDMLSFSDVL